MTQSRNHQSFFGRSRAPKFLFTIAPTLVKLLRVGLVPDLVFLSDRVFFGSYFGKIGDPVPSVTGGACCFRWVSRIRTYRDGTAVGNVANVVSIQPDLIALLTTLMNLTSGQFYLLSTKKGFYLGKF